MDTRRDSDNSDASAPYFCVSCGRAYSEAAGHGSGIDAPFRRLRRLRWSRKHRCLANYSVAVAGDESATLARASVVARRTFLVEWSRSVRSKRAAATRYDRFNHWRGRSLTANLRDGGECHRRRFSSSCSAVWLRFQPSRAYRWRWYCSCRSSRSVCRTSSARSSRRRLMLPGRISVGPAMRRPCSHPALLVALVLGGSGPLALYRFLLLSRRRQRFEGSNTQWVRANSGRTRQQAKPCMDQPPPLLGYPCHSRPG
jgi:hypothetical protein